VQQSDQQWNANSIVCQLWRAQPKLLRCRLVSWKFMPDARATVPNHMQAALRMPALSTLIRKALSAWLTVVIKITLHVMCTRGAAGRGLSDNGWLQLLDQTWRRFETRWGHLHVDHHIVTCQRQADWSTAHVQASNATIFFTIIVGRLLQSLWT